MEDVSNISALSASKPVDFHSTTNTLKTLLPLKRPLGQMLGNQQPGNQFQMPEVFGKKPSENLNIRLNLGNSQPQLANIHSANPMLTTPMFSNGFQNETAQLKLNQPG